ncbi:MAG TPA: amino acid adenylation domain-containing protein [Bacillota bacterium]|nr:amino acid adenylation domain-containing protein [Bacillota bacterium]
MSKERVKIREGVDIAVVGMAGKFPGAENIQEFWRNLIHGIESIHFFSDEELLQAGVKPELLQNPDYVRAKGIIPGIEDFDADFFNYSPRDATLMDPQSRLFHEYAWLALEDAGYNPDSYKGLIGVYAGASNNVYWEFLSFLAETGREPNNFALALQNNKDLMSTHLSYKFDLKGPSFTNASACSTSLVSIHLACQGLLSGDCDLALAGGVAIALPDKTGYLYQEGMILSRDGHCRAFDAQATGMVYGNGVGIVVLKRIEDAIRDCDHIYAVIKGSAVNNDGKRKIGYTAPSINGQAEVIRNSHQMAEVEPESISYVETHGTGTDLGDSIEIEGLKTAFNSTRKKFCAIGSVKTNVGHLDSAAGVTGFIKTVLSLKNHLIPPSLNFTQPNPKLELDNSPFFVNIEPREWRNSTDPLRAGVSSFGIGGTNAHIVLEESPEREPSGMSRPWQMLLLSAKCPAALERMTDNLTQYLQNNPEVQLADLAYTLQVGRKGFEYRRVLVCANTAEALEILKSKDERALKTLSVLPGKPSPIFMFPGQGAQYPEMGRELYEQEAIFRETLQDCFRRLEPLVEWRPRSIWAPIPAEAEDAKTMLTRTEVAQPLIFCFEYALATLLMEWGIKPAALIGYSFGEYAAACIAGVFTLEDALQLIVTRGRLMGKLSNGAMLSIPLPAEQVVPLIEEFNGAIPRQSDHLALAIDNGLSAVVAGVEWSVAKFETLMKEKRYLCLRIDLAQAAHSGEMDSILEEFRQAVAGIKLNPPRIPYISGISGTWIENAQATDPSYWVSHLRETIRFSKGVELLTREANSILIEVGPGRDLSILAHRFLEDQPERIIDLVRNQNQRISDLRFLLLRLARLWALGLPLNWGRYYKDESRQRIPLPGYSFEHRRFWIEGNLDQMLSGATVVAPDKDAFETTGNHRLPALFNNEKPEVAKWFYEPVWERAVSAATVPGEPVGDPNALWIIFGDQKGLGACFFEQLRKKGLRASLVEQGDHFQRSAPQKYIINPAQEADYQALLQAIIENNQGPLQIGHFWGITGDADKLQNLTLPELDQIQEQGIYSLLYLLKAITGSGYPGNVNLKVVTNQLVDVLGNEQICPAKSTILGMVKLVSFEYSQIACSGIDLIFPTPETALSGLLERLYEEFLIESSGKIVAYRGNYRWVQNFKQVFLKENPASGLTRLKEKGVYLITGGLGGQGLKFAEFLAKTCRAKLVLLGRSAFPEKQSWENWVGSHDPTDEISRRIRLFRELETWGAEVLALSGDVTDLPRMQAIVARVMEVFGAIDGVIHAAGLADYEGIIHNRTRESIESIMAPKVWGTIILERVLRDFQLDFFIMCSSIGSILPQIGQVGYCAANNFLDTFAGWKRRTNATYTVAINWDSWQEVGMTARAANFWEGKFQQLDVTQILANKILPVEGIEAWKLILASNFQQLIVTPDQLPVIFFDYLKLVRETLEKSSLRSKSLGSRTHLHTEYLPPRNETEQKLVQIWQDFFGVEQLGILDDFFELGGDSLKAITLLSKIHKELGIRAGLAEFMKNGCIAQFCQIAFPMKGETFTAIPAAPTKEYYDLSSTQQRIFILGQMEPDATSYNMFNVWRITGTVDPGRLKKAFTTVLARHESLRTTFTIIESQPVQLIHPTVDLEFEFYETPETEIPELIRRFKRPFDLTKAPLLRVGLARVRPDESFLFIDIHHIIADGFSNNIIIKEVMTTYQARELPPLKVQYKDYAEWEKNRKEQAEFKAKEQYWLAIYADGEIPQLNLPYDNPRPRVQSTAGRIMEFELNLEESEAIKAVAKNQETTLYSLLLSVFTIFLAKLSGQEDIIIGTPVAGRNHADLENVVGMFVNTLALRNYPQGSKWFPEYLKEVHERTMEAFERQEYPFEELVEKLAIERDVSRNPMFDVMFGFQSLPTPEIQIPGLSCVPYPFERTDSQFDLSLDVQEIRGRLRFTFEYCTKLFRDETIHRFGAYLQKILHMIGATPQVKLMDLELISETEKQWLLNQINQTGHDYPQDRTVHELFEEQVVKTPKATAIIAGERRLTYAELNQRANQLARTLLRHGVSGNPVVALLAGPTPERVVGMLGIIKAGAAYLPLPLEAPPERIKYLLQDSRARLLLITPELHEQAHTYSELAESLLIPETLGEETGANLDLKVQPEVLVYLTYTSGTTGQPKGVMTSHRNLVNFISWLGFSYQITRDDQYISLTQYHFDPSAGDIFVTLVHGATLHLVDKYMMLNKSELRSYITHHQIGIINTVPTLIKELLGGAPKLASIRTVISGGERLEESVKDELVATGYQVYNHYGPTETTIDTLAVQCGPGKVTIGRPIWNMRAYIVDQYLRLAPPGVTGELCLSGAGVSPGYFGAPELTATKFVNCPFEAGTKMYRSGDLVKLNQELMIEYLGRMDEQVKIRGIRIELQEIETILAQYPGIKDVVVVCREDGNQDGGPLGDGPLGRYIAAYYTGGVEISQLELRNHLAESLPDSFIPACFTQLEKLPVNLNGKIDKSRLPKPDLRSAAAYEPPSDAVEVYLSEIWRQVLAIEDPGVHDNFFQVGGSSLLIIKMKTLLEYSYPWIHVIDLFTYPTIAKLAAYIRQTEGASAEGGFPALSLESATLMLPKDYYHESGESCNSSEAVDFQFAIGPRLREKISGRSSALKSEPIDILTGLYLYLLAELTGGEALTIPGVFGKGNELRLLTVNLSEINTIDDLIQTIHQIRDSRGPCYPVRELYKLPINPPPGGVIPLILQRGPDSIPFNFREKFDLVMEIRERPTKIEIAFEFNRKKLDQAKIENLIQLYLGLINNITKQEGLADETETI